jgi:membrane-associated phospholipid phosphatase
VHPKVIFYNPEPIVAAEHSPVDRACRILWLGASIATALALGGLLLLAYRQSVDIDWVSGIDIWCTVACFALVGAIARSRGLRAIEAVAFALTLIVLATVLAGAAATIGLSLRFPVTDKVFGDFDRAMGLDIAAYVDLLSRFPTAASILKWLYESTGMAIIAIVFHLGLGGRLSRLAEFAFLMTTTIVATCAIGIQLPSRSSLIEAGVSAETLSSLPKGLGVYYMNQFELWYAGPPRVFSFQTLIGVVQIPSFHTVMVLLCVWTYRDRPVALGLWLIYAALIGISILPCGGHYILDIIGGAVLLVLAILSGRWLQTGRAATAPHAGAGASPTAAR